MLTRWTPVFGTLITALLVTAPPALPQSLAELHKQFIDPPDDARIMMRWWWFGPSVTKAGIDRELRLMKEGGIGGFEVQPVYPLALDDPGRGFRNLPFLSDEFLEALRFTAEKAREYGLRMDLTLGSGWPYGGAHIPVTQAAGRLRVQRVKVTAGSRRVPVPSIGNGEQLIGAFDSASRRELSGIRDGVLWLPEGATAPEQVWFFIASRTGMMVKRPALGGEGFVIDHYDRGALDTYLKNAGERLMSAFGPVKPHAIFCDSLEVFGSDWTPALLEEFRKRRGYDLKPHLPALVADAGPQTAAIRHDWGRTLTELLEERFLQPMQQWVKSQGASFRIQNYGMPPARLASHAYADLPEGEGSQWKVLRAARWASSASHLYGRAGASSETWTWLHSPVFRATPLDMKAEADLHFLQGITQLIGHGWAYTPEGEPYPGWRFYAAAVFNEKNPWWIVMPDVARYFQRMSFLLRQGRPANDVALYLPTADAWSSFTAGRVHMIETLRERVGGVVIPQILEPGYGLDFFDDGSLEQVGRVDGDALVLGGNRYRVVVLPGVEYMPLATLRKLEEFVKGGGIVIATRRAPSAVPGLKAAQAEQTEFRMIADRIFAPAQSKVRVVAKDEGLGAAMQSLLTPDLRAPAGIGFLHRTTGAAEIYFVVNTANTRVRGEAEFRVTGREVESWDAMNGRAHSVSAARGSTGIALTLDLAPYESRVFVFPRQPRALPRAPSTARTVAAVDLSSGWKVTVDGGSPVSMDPLRSWTEDERTRFYSGTATYEREVELETGAAMRLDFGEGTPAGAAGQRAGSGMRALLDGPVREAAVVYVNGKRAGSVWSAPYEVNLTGLLKAGRNQLRIVVANTAVNYMAGHAQPDYRLLNLRYGVRFEPQDMRLIKPEASGLLGKIRLVPTGE